MARILTGIQSTGTPHLGNILGAIIPGIELSKKKENEAFFFIADLHSLTQIKDGELLRKNTYATAATWLAFGFDTSTNVFYRQSDVAAEVCQLNWFLNCYTPFPMLSNAHSFKDKSEKLSDVNAGLFVYPVLMAADIIGYNANFVPVGKDQQQHLEMTRDIAASFNHTHGETFVIPEGLYDERVMVVPGTDGQKMSKSYNNFIDIFLSDKALRKQIMKIETDSTPIDEPKKWETCNAFVLYALLADENQIAKMKTNYATPGYGYGHAKQALFELICEKFTTERARFNELMDNTDELDRQLAIGAEKAKAVIAEVLAKVKSKTGY